MVEPNRFLIQRLNIDLKTAFELLENLKLDGMVIYNITITQMIMTKDKYRMIINGVNKND